MVPVEWARPALNDLREVYDYIARDSQRYAQITVEKIRDAAARLGEAPHLGHEVPDLPPGPYLQTLVGNYRILYRLTPSQDRVLIMGVIHAARDLPSIMKNR